MSDVIKNTLKKIYRTLPFKKKLFDLIKIVYSPSEKIYQHLYFTGNFKVNVDRQHFFWMRHYGFEIENHVYWKGLTAGWEKVSISLWIKLCKNSKVIFDVGANTGLYALIAKAVNQSAKIYAFEPVERVYEKLKTNIVLNSFDIIISDKALSNKDGNAIIYDIPDAPHMYSVTVNQNIFAPGTPVRETKILTTTIDTFCESNNISKIDLLKIDVETHEPEVLKGYMQCIRIHKPDFLIEILNDEVGERVQALISGMDYLYFNIDENKGLTQVYKIGKSDYFNYLICSHETARKLELVM